MKKQESGEKISLYKFSDKISVNLIFERLSTDKGTFICKFANNSRTTNNENMKYAVSYTFGKGITPIDAMNDYISRLQGQILVVDIIGCKNKEFPVPELEMEKSSPNSGKVFC